MKTHGKGKGKRKGEGCQEDLFTTCQNFPDFYGFPLPPLSFWRKGVRSAAAGWD